MFAEAFAVPPVIHAVAGAQRALAIGPAAASLLTVASRYPYTELVYLGEDAPSQLRSPVRADKRVRIVHGTRDLPRDWYADVIGIAVPGTPESALSAARQLAGPTTVVVVAADRAQAAPALRRMLQSLWKSVAPYREYLPDRQLFFLASDLQLSTKRPIPAWTRRLNEPYMLSMFRFPKDEYSALYSPAPVVPTVSNLKGPS
jgi:hypothetical protein